jgi:hypothetical protein
MWRSGTAGQAGAPGIVCIQAHELSISPFSFLEEQTDAQKLDEAIARDELGYKALGNETYLGFLFESPEKAHDELRQKLGLRGKIQWIELAKPHVTG